MSKEEAGNMFALFKGDKQITKPHSTKAAVLVEAYERGLVTSGLSDFPGQMRGVSTIALDKGHSIREVTQPTQHKEGG